MGALWAVARQTISEGVRMRIVVVFLLLIAAVVLGLPFTIEGDSSLTGAVQSFLSYSLITTSFLLALLTVFMLGSLSNEIVDRQLFLVVTKPIPRWQLIFGKWLGITLLNFCFLAVTGVAIYGMVHYLRTTREPIDEVYDRQELENQILVARHAIQMELPDFRTAAEREFELNREQGLYALNPEFNPEKIKASLKEKHEARWRVIGPLDTRVFEFENVLTARSPDDQIQIRYFAEVSRYPPDEILRAEWILGDPVKGTAVYRVPTRHVVGRYHVVPAPADCVAEDHTLRVQFINRNPFQNEPQFQNVVEIRPRDGVEVLFVVGTFGGNLFRLLILVFCKLMFLAAVGLLFASLFSFPVACLAAFTVYALAGTRRFFEDALDWISVDQAPLFSSFYEFTVQTIQRIYEVVMLVIPSFGRYDAVENLVNGRNVSLVWVLQGVGELALLKTTLVLGLAMLFFYRRELAETSV